MVSAQNLYMLHTLVSTLLSLYSFQAKIHILELVAGMRRRLGVQRGCLFFIRDLMSFGITNLSPRKMRPSVTASSSRMLKYGVTRGGSWDLSFGQPLRMVCLSCCSAGSQLVC